MSKETYYISRGGHKRPQPRLLTKLKGHLIESVAWNLEEQTDQTTGAILFGTSEGNCLITMKWSLSIIIQFTYILQYTDITLMLYVHNYIHQCMVILVQLHVTVSCCIIETLTVYTT